MIAALLLASINEDLERSGEPIVGPNLSIE
jgi:hypothetical protein